MAFTLSKLAKHIVSPASRILPRLCIATTTTTTPSFSSFVSAEASCPTAFRRFLCSTSTMATGNGHRIMVAELAPSSDKAHLETALQLKKFDRESGPVADGYVLIDVKAAGINFADLLMVQGKYQEQPPLPFCPGAEASGIVEQVGEGAVAGDGTILKQGMKVMLCSLGSGSYSNQVEVPARMCFAVPSDTWTFEQSAAFPIAFGTGFVGLVNRGGMKPGDTVLVTGASGGCGAAAVMIAKAFDCRVIATARGSEKCTFVEKLGADLVIDVKGNDAKVIGKDLTEKVLDLTDNKGVQVVFDTVGSDLFPALLKSIKWSATIVVVGFAGGHIPKVPANILLVKNSAVSGLYWGAHFMKDPKVIRDSFKELKSLVETGKLPPLPIGGVYPLEHASAALSDMASSKVIGKLILDCDWNNPKM